MQKSAPCDAGSTLCGLVHPFIAVSWTTLRRSGAGWCGVAELILSPTRDKARYSVTKRLYPLHCALSTLLRRISEIVYKLFVTLRRNWRMIGKTI